MYAFVIMAGVVQLLLPLGIQDFFRFLMGGTVCNSIILLILLVVFRTFLNGLLYVKQLEIIKKVKQKIPADGLKFSGRLLKLDT